MLVDHSKIVQLQMYLFILSSVFIWGKYIERVELQIKSHEKESFQLILLEFKNYNGVITYWLEGYVLNNVQTNILLKFWLYSDLQNLIGIKLTSWCQFE